MMSLYWDKRNEEHRYIKSQYKSDEDYKKELLTIYNNTQSNIQKEIDAELLRYAGNENLSLADIKTKVLKHEVDLYNDKVRTYVLENKITPELRSQLNLYNIRTRVNRLELLNSTIRLEIIDLADKENKKLTERLELNAMKEYKRQAGLLGESVPTRDHLRRIAKTIVEADYKGAHFSDRIWINQKELQRKLEGVIERTLIQGKHPREGARDLRVLVDKQCKSQRYVSERLAITESARVQDSVQRKSFEDFNVEEYEWIAEPDACGECNSYDGTIYKLNDNSAPTVPAHPFCRCSIAGYIRR